MELVGQKFAVTLETEREGAEPCRGCMAEKLGHSVCSDLPDCTGIIFKVKELKRVE